MPHRVLFALLCSGLAIEAAAAQSTWIVDPQNRPGAHFSDVPPAIAASTPGDTIFVRSSQVLINLSTTTSKGITVRGEGSHRFSGMLRIVGLPADQRFVLQGLRPPSTYLELQALATVVAVQGCLGTVHLQEMACQPLALAQPTTLQISVSDSPHVTIRACTIAGTSAGLDVRRSRVLAIDCLFEGNLLSVHGSTPVRSTSVAATLTDAELIAIDCIFRGGGGTYGPVVVFAGVPEPSRRANAGLDPLGRCVPADGRPGGGTIVPQLPVAAIVDHRRRDGDRSGLHDATATS